MRIAAVLALTGGCAIFAQPMISPRGIVNAATFMPPGLPSGAIARGSYFSIFGVNLTFQNTSPPTSYPLSNNLGGIQVLVTIINDLSDFFLGGLHLLVQREGFRLDRVYRCDWP